MDKSIEDLEKAVQDLSPKDRAEISQILEMHLKTFREEMKEEANQNFRLSDNARDDLKYMIGTFLLSKTTTNEAHHYICGYLAGYQSGRYD